MSTQVIGTQGAATVSSEDMDQLLGELVVTEGPENDAEIIEALDSADEAVIEAEVERIEAVESQTVTTADTAPSAETVAAAAAAAPKKAKTPSEPRVSRDVGALKADFFVLTTDVPADLEANKVAVMGTRPEQKKIAEKFDNVLTSIAAGKLPSVYVVECFKVLQAKGSATSTELVTALKAAKYTDGTARSQAGQIMALFATLKIADRAGSTLTLRADSTLATALAGLIGTGS